MHHLITDGATTSLLYAQMSTIYTNLLNDSLEIQTPLGSFEEYILYEQNERNSPKNEVNRSYWKEQMERI